jgi:PRC-barrel domain protein
MSVPQRKIWIWAMAISLAVGNAATSSGGLAQSAKTEAADEAPGVGTVSGADLEHFSPDHLFRVLGRDVVSATGESMGRIVDVLFDRDGKPCAAVVDFGGFLGVGMRKIAVDWHALYFNLGAKKNVIALDLGRDQLKAAPEYKETDKPIAVVTLPRPGQKAPE